MLIKIFVILMLVAIFVSLFSALVFLFRNKGQSTRTAQALTWRIGLSLTLFILLMAADFTSGSYRRKAFRQFAERRIHRINGIFQGLQDYFENL